MPKSLLNFRMNYHLKKILKLSIKASHITHSGKVKHIFIFFIILIIFYFIFLSFC